jgi:hypothetical protein
MKCTLNALLVICLVLSFSACTKKSGGDELQAGEAVEGASSAASENVADSPPPDEMQQKEKKDEASNGTEGSEKP